MLSKGVIISVNIAAAKGEKKNPADAAVLRKGGVDGDAHFSSDREVSLLDWKSVEKLIFERGGNKNFPISPGDFAENITTAGVDFSSAEIGAAIIITPPDGDKNEVALAITSIGKTCHNSCRIKQTLGDCVMPREGIFARVIKGGEVRPGYIVTLSAKEPAAE